jgi:hypothetical protein
MWPHQFNRRAFPRTLVALIAVTVVAGEKARVAAWTPPEAEPLKAVLHLRIDDVSNSRRRNLRLDQAQALPLQAGDRFRIEARLNRAAYVYLLWIGSDGKVGPVNPWTRGKWELRPAHEQKVDRLELPEKADSEWEIPSGSPGNEALLLLVREGSPLPRGEEARLAKLVSETRVPSATLMKEPVWLENGREITLDPQDRAAPSFKTRKSDDPVLRIRRLLQEKVQASGDYYQALVFPNQGGK